MNDQKGKNDMIRPIMHDPIFLAIPSRDAAEADLPIARDLLDTLMAHQAGCVGMAANMIGKNVAIIAFFDGAAPMIMLNPKIIMQLDPYETEEGCLSLDGLRKTIRYRKIKVEYQNDKMQKKMRTFSGFTAQIIQHELDHCRGILI